MQSGQDTRTGLPSAPTEVSPTRARSKGTPHRCDHRRRARVSSRLPALNDRIRSSYEIRDGLRQNVARIADPKRYGILLDVSGVPMHVMLVVRVVDQSNRAPSTVSQDLEHCGVKGHRSATVANQDAYPISVQRYYPLAIELHRQEAGVPLGWADSWRAIKPLGSGRSAWRVVPRCVAKLGRVSRVVALAPFQSACGSCSNSASTRESDFERSAAVTGWFLSSESSRPKSAGAKQQHMKIGADRSAVSY
jgi:hypothetical protein